MTLQITLGHHAARNAASLALADAGSGASSLRLYDSAGTLLGTCVLAKPCGTIQADGAILLQPAPEPEIAVASGAAVRLDWCDGHGAPMASGTVTAEGGGGDFELTGTSGTQIYAGALVLLQGVVIG
ncbi:MAG: hypothetical protein ABT03_14675 [Comamonas sp. SCN 67-35]|uniref:hypothetical protein n=1 Tax=Comamonas sp. SCN 67-35 TaxID=1660096 RepID=UPI00086DF0A5|nr:hypothetical protein [Comamonas sp. SCN 67-35]ODU36953.1 MAG: hypothetical protein ABT03_14675 [Comamonas sp. SCN 67-35]OJV73919.1 MAG: hypothetical protein BGO35_03945 [Burkholderiales bacterium 64-34]